MRCLPIRDGHDDYATVAAIGLLAMCLVTFDHEALGHGGACLASGGHITLLTSSLFRCSLRSIWIDPAGPFANLLGGTLSLLLLTFAPSRSRHWRLFLILVTGFSSFWEAGYAVDAMRSRHGDLYFAALDFLGAPDSWWRIAGAAAGIGFYLATARWVSRRISGLCATARAARCLARTAWVSATLGAGLAALTYAGDGWADLRDAVLEFGAGSFPLLLLPPQNGGAAVQTQAPAPAIQRNKRAIVLSSVVYLIFIATLGRGLRA